MFVGLLCLEQRKGKEAMATPKQVSALKYLIAKNRDGRDLTKRILFLLIEASHGLTKEVSVCLGEDTDGSRDGYTSAEIKDAVDGFEAMESSTCSTHLDAVMKLTGSDFGFSSHVGYPDKKMLFDTALHPRHDGLASYMFWLGKESWGHSGEKIRLLEVSRKELQAIDFSRPGRYPEREGKKKTT